MDSKKSPGSKRRTPPYILGVVVLLLLTFLILLQSSNLWKSLNVDSASDTLLLYALSSLNFIAFVIFGFIFFRNLLKLIQERRAFKLGAKIKTRLMIYFFAVSMLPLIAMAVFSYLFMNRALERWFSDIPENVVREAREVQNQSVRDQNAKLNETALMLAAILQNPTDENLQAIAEKGNLARIEVVSVEGRVLASGGKNLSPEQTAELEKVLSLSRQNRFDEPVLSDGKGFDAAIAELPENQRLVIVPGLLSEENVSQMVDNALREFDNLKKQNVFIRQIGLSTLGLLTFLLIFAASWTAFYVAKGITKPIQALAEGADEIARGNLSHRVQVLAEDELELLVSSFNQMSARLEANSAELSERRRYIETVLQSLSTGVISFDDENRITTINRAALQMLRLEEADFIYFDLKNLVSEENHLVLETLISRAKRAGQASEQTFLKRENANANSETAESLPVALTATALPDENGVVLVIEDLSELIAAQRASAWAEVARRMAHEIKNPLTPIQLAAERIAKRFLNFRFQFSDSKFVSVEKEKNLESEIWNPELAKVVDESTSTILREVSSLKSMVDEFSRFARLPNARLENKNLNEIVEKTILLYEDRFSDVKIELKLAEKMPEIMIDEEQIKRVFVNLIDNSIEAFEENQEDKRIFIKTFHDWARDLVVAEISDNGKGIPPRDLNKLFQPYFSTKGRGTGLGLPIVQRIVTEHRGKIRAVNNSVKGAKFIIELPV